MLIYNGERMREPRGGAQADKTGDREVGSRLGLYELNERCYKRND